MEGSQRSRRRRHGELPALDGIRAVAVLAVMLYHFGVGGMRGGFLGVDVFFVLSGYLITGQLVTRWVYGPAVSLTSFWLARARRLLPGLGILLLGTSTAVLALDRSQVSLFRGDLTAAATYSSNWWYVFHSRSYFVAAGRPPLLQHLWSLAVEEQFYLVWPLVVAAVVATCSSAEVRRRVLIWAALGIALASSLVMGIGSALGHAPEAGDPSRWYFGSDSHVMGLLIGALLALVRRGDHLGSERIRRLAPATRWDTAAGTAALVVLLYMLSQTDEFSVWLYRWGFVAVSMLAAVVIAAATKPGPLAIALSRPILRGIGKRSYALYLWHWPVACFTRPGVDLPVPGWLALALRLALTFVLAEAGYRYIELPVRERGWRAFRASLAGIRVGAVRAPTIIMAFVTVLVTAMMLPATASTPGRPLASGGTVYVADPGHPGTVRVVKPGGSLTGSARGTGRGPGGSSRLPGIQLPTVPDATSGPRHLTGRDGPPPPAPPPPPSTPPRTVSDLRKYDLAVYADSVALGAIPDLATTFRSVTNDATEGVQSWTLLPQLAGDARSGRLDGDIVLLHTGDNGVVNRSQLDSALGALASARRVIVAVPWVPRQWQADNRATIESVVGHYHNVVLLPWDSAVSSHPDYVWSDKIHLTPTGEHAYTALVAAAAIAR